MINTTAVQFLHPLLKLAGEAVFAGQLLGWISCAPADLPGVETPAAPPSPVPSSLHAVWRALSEFDYFLDARPALETQLRLKPTLVFEQDFLRRNSKLRAFLRLNPSVTAGLEFYPRYFLDRALLRLAGGRLWHQDLVPFAKLFEQQPRLEQELTGKPELIRDSAYLESHGALRDFFIAHPELARMFLAPRAARNPN